MAYHSLILVEIDNYQGNYVKTDNKYNAWNTWNQFRLVPSKLPVINPPPVATKFVDIPGRIGSLDLTSYQTGYRQLADRTGSIEFLLMNDYGSTQARVEEIANLISGKLMRVYLEDEYEPLPSSPSKRTIKTCFEGRINVREPSIDGHFNRIIFEYRFKPNRYEIELPWAIINQLDNYWPGIQTVSHMPHLKSNPPLHEVIQTIEDDFWSLIETPGSILNTYRTMVYPTFQALPATPDEDSIIYIIEDTGDKYYYDSDEGYRPLSELISKLWMEYQKHSSSAQFTSDPFEEYEVRQYSDASSFPVAGQPEVLYLDMTAREAYVWRNNIYERVEVSDDYYDMQVVEDDFDTLP